MQYIENYLAEFNETWFEYSIELDEQIYQKKLERVSKWLLKMATDRGTLSALSDFDRNKYVDKFAGRDQDAGLESELGRHLHLAPSVSLVMSPQTKSGDILLFYVSSSFTIIIIPHIFVHSVSQR